MIKEFKEFAMRGNVLDMAVGIIIGAAFGQIVTSFVAGYPDAPDREASRPRGFLESFREPVRRALRHAGGGKSRGRGDDQLRAFF